MKKIEPVLDVSLHNLALWCGCAVTTREDGALRLIESPDTAVVKLRRNAQLWQFGLSLRQRNAKVVVTGPMAVWAHMTVVAVLADHCHYVVYRDGAGAETTIYDNRIPWMGLLISFLTMAFIGFGVYGLVSWLARLF